MEVGEEVAAKWEALAVSLCVYLRLRAPYEGNSLARMLTGEPMAHVGQRGF